MRLINDVVVSNIESNIETSSRDPLLTPLRFDVMKQLTTPDGRYVIVRDRLWRTVDPNIPAQRHRELVNQLMAARRDVRAAKRSGQSNLLSKARAAVHATKVALGERGAVWWTDGAKDWNRYLVKNTPYAEWYEHVLTRERSHR